MTQTELIKRLARRTDLNMKEINLFLKELGLEAQKALLAGDEICLPGIGKLSARLRKERIGRNPATGDKMLITARRVAVFNPIKNLKDAINP
ncbi:HU family DNA-binding protein [Ampullimonas aquatilis]|uniref:HU family DNA-binding protein n=1 Tax=Ampullimonas aquatilis TaxID=1341549 RepID=UPI003C76D99D